MVKIIGKVFSALMILLVVNCGRDEQELTRRRERESNVYRSPKGFTVEPLKTDREELAVILGIDIWKFKMITEDTERLHEAVLEIQHPGREPEEVYSHGISGLLDTEIVFTVALYSYPLAGKSMRNGRLGIVLMSTRVTPDGGRASGSGRAVIDDPGADIAFPGTTLIPRLREDGGYVLRFYSPSGRYPDPENSLLVFKVRVKEGRDER